jgi:restriction system protein
MGHLALAIFLFLAVILKSSWFKGHAGEFIVRFSSKWLLNKDEYHFINDVTLPTEDGTTQIDHIIVSIFGIFVVETKNIKGWIFGDQNQKKWTQSIYGHKNQFQNPLRQNYKHIKTLESLLGIAENKIFSVIVFVGDSTFKTQMPENVTYGSGYAKYIKSKNEPILSVNEVNNIIEIIHSIRLERSFKTNREHIKHVKSIIAKKEGNIEEKQNDRLSSKAAAITIVLVVLIIFYNLTKPNINDKRSSNIQQGSNPTTNKPTVYVEEPGPSQSNQAPVKTKKELIVVLMNNGQTFIVKNYDINGDYYHLTSDNGIEFKVLRSNVLEISSRIIEN